MGKTRWVAEFEAEWVPETQNEKGNPGLAVVGGVRNASNDHGPDAEGKIWLPKKETGKYSYLRAKKKNNAKRDFQFWGDP